MPMKAGTREPEVLVERFVTVFLAFPDADCGAIVERLEQEHISREVAEALLAFVPMAFAHALLGPMGVSLPTGFVAWEPDTNEKETGVLKGEPLFAAALSVAASLEAASVRAVATCSAEWQVIQDLTADSSDPSGCVLTEPLLARVPLSFFRRPAGATGWRPVWNWLTGR